MSSRTFDGNLESAGSGFCPAPPPPPPPPVPGQVPALKINTVEASVPRRLLPNNNNNNPYEPPAAIQNAMMTKDKKPFTYTPGMGGKLDLSQIRSPRMARRVAKNANDEGIEGPPKSSLAAEPRPLSAAPNLYIQPQVAVPVFPTNMPSQPSANRAAAAPPARVPSNVSDRAAENLRPVTRVETKMAPITQVVSPQATPPETPTTPPQVTLAKAPTPWLQNKNKPQEELPEWAKRSSVVRPSSSTSPESPQNQSHQSQPQVLQTIQLQQSPASPMRQQQQQSPPPPKQQSQPQERVIPLRIEDRPSVFSVKNEPGHHQFKQQQQQPSSHHQQRWGNHTPPQTPLQAQMPQFQNQNHQQYQQTPRPQSSGGGTYIVPIMVEGSSNNGVSPYNQQQPIQARNQSIQNQSPRVIVQRGPPSPQIQQQGEPGPVQSRSFRVLQKITDTDAPDEVDGEQLRKLQLTEDDKILMNKFKEQVDGDGTYLHQEEDPRYRGAAIPSRAFRLLQNMTDSGDVTTTANAPRTPSAINKRQNRNSRTFEESQANLPASEQQAPEPKKYTGSAIPSRSFRILQAMTSPESIAKQENRQAVITCRNESSMHPGNHQQGVFLSSSFPDDSAPQSLVEQSQYYTSELPSPQSQTSQSHYSQSSEIPLSQLQQYDTQSHKLKSEGLQSLETQIKWAQLQPSQIQFAHLQFSQSHLSQMQLLQLQPSQSSQSQPLESQPSKSQPSKSQPSQSQPSQSQPSQSQPSQSQPSQSRPSQSRPSQSRPSKSQPSQSQLSHFQTSRLHKPRLHTPRLQIPQLQVPLLQTPQTSPSQTPQSQKPRLQTPQLQTPQLQTPQLQTPQLQTPQLQTPQLQTPQLQTPQLQTPQLQTPQLQTPQLQTPQLQTPQLQTPQLQTPQLQTPQLQTPQLQTPQLQTPQLQTPQLQTPQLQTPQLQTPQLQTPQLQTPQLQVPLLQTPQTSQSQTPQSQKPRLQTPQLQTPQLQTPQLQTPQLQTPQLQTPQLQTPQLQTPQLQTPQLQTPQLQTPQLQTPQLQTPQLQTPQLQTPQLQTPQLQTPQLQTPQLQTPQLSPRSPAFWQQPHGSCWWGYYPVHYPPLLNATTPPSSSLSSSSSSIPKYNPPILQHISPAPYENYAYYTGCHHHHRQDENAFAYYHPFYDARLYAAITAAATCATNANGIPPSDAGALQLCTDLSSSSSSSSCSSSSCSSSSLNGGTLADVSNVLVTEDCASSCQLLASTPSTNLLRASASCPVPVFIHKPSKKLPGYDSNCNPCLERAERSCTAETSIFRCPPVFVLNPANTPQGLPVFRGVNARTRDREQGTRDNLISNDPALTEPGPPPWMHNIQNSLRLDDNGTEIAGRVEQAGSSIEQCNEVGWNLDGTIGIQDKSIIRQVDECLNRMKLKGTEIDAARYPHSNYHSELEKQKCHGNNDEANGIDKKFNDEKPKWNKKNIEPNRIDKKFENENPQQNASNVENSKVENPRWNRSSTVLSRDDRDSDIVDQRWNRIDNASRNLNENAPSIPMNILHDERNVNESPVVDKVKNNDGQSFDRSEDANPSDSEIDTSSNDSSADPEQVCNDHATNTEDESDSESDSDDSDSYLAYSTGLNPHDKLVRQSNNSTAIQICADKESTKSQTSITSSEDDLEETSFATSADRLNATDCESCVEEDDEIMEVAKTEEEQDTNMDTLQADDITPHRLSVIPEDGEQNDRGGASPNTIGSDGWQNVAEDRNADLTTVSVSLPLRFRFSVMENEGDVTTVIVGKSTVKTETSVKSEDTDEVCVKLKLVDDADTSADFTLRRNVSREIETREPDEREDETNEIDFWETEDKTFSGMVSNGLEEKSGNEGADETNIISRSNSKTRVPQDDCIDFWETITSGRVSPDLSYNSKRQSHRIDNFSWRETDSRKDEETEELEEDKKKNSIDDESIKDEIPTLNINDSRCCEEEDEEEADEEEEEDSEAEENPDEETLQTSKENENEASPKNGSTPLFELTEAKNNDNEELNGRSNLENSKHLLSIQNSRDETDDEDSGVTSDMSRLISEVDTDSECGPTRKINTYKRTQTHSRLFRLLSREDDPQGLEDMPKNTSAQRDRLSLPLKNSGFSYDESHHCSNYSSGLTSPDYSPVYEGTWRRLHGDDNGTSEKPNSPGGLDNDDESSKNRKDPYFENWKKTVTENKIQEEKIASSNALKIVDCGTGGGLPNWRFRTNVLCPRIKSTKNVPRTIRNNRTAKPVISISSTSNSVGKSNDNVFLTKYG